MEIVEGQMTTQVFRKVTDHPDGSGSITGIHAFPCNEIRLMEREDGTVGVSFYNEDTGTSEMVFSPLAADTIVWLGEKQITIAEVLHGNH